VTVSQGVLVSIGAVYHVAMLIVVAHFIRRR